MISSTMLWRPWRAHVSTCAVPPEGCRLTYANNTISGEWLGALHESDDNVFEMAAYSVPSLSALLLPTIPKRATKTKSQYWTSSKWSHYLLVRRLGIPLHVALPVNRTSTDTQPRVKCDICFQWVASWCAV